MSALILDKVVSIEVLKVSNNLLDLLVSDRVNGLLGSSDRVEEINNDLNFSINIVIYNSMCRIIGMEWVLI